MYHVTFDLWPRLVSPTLAVVSTSISEVYQSVLLYLKLFEHCILRRFNKYLVSSDNQFGFKKLWHALMLFAWREVCFEHHISYCSTLNLCALDVFKAFDKMSHHFSRHVLWSLCLTVIMSLYVLRSLFPIKSRSYGRRCISELVDQSRFLQQIYSPLNVKFISELHNTEQEYILSDSLQLQLMFMLRSLLHTAYLPAYHLMRNTCEIPTCVYFIPWETPACLSLSVKRALVF